MLEFLTRKYSIGGSAIEIGLLVGVLDFGCDIDH